MPLKKGATQKIIWTNVKTLMNDGKRREQAIAIAMRKAGKKRVSKEK
jgi:hypothetical protein